jgi:hypothetical protein
MHLRLDQQKMARARNSKEVKRVGLVYVCSFSTSCSGSVPGRVMQLGLQNAPARLDIIGRVVRPLPAAPKRLHPFVALSLSDP